jgi:hypothetical protein
MRLLCGVAEVTELSRGAMQTKVVTAPECNISSGMSSTFVAQAMLLLLSWEMEAS